MVTAQWCQAGVETTTSRVTDALPIMPPCHLQLLLSYKHATVSIQIWYHFEPSGLDIACSFARILIVGLQHYSTLIKTASLRQLATTYVI